MATQEVAYTVEPARAQPLEEKVDRLYTPAEARARLGLNTHYLRCLANNGRIEDRDYLYTAASVECFRDELQRYVPISQFITEAVHGKNRLRMSKDDVRTLIARLRQEEPEAYQRYFVDMVGPKRPSRYKKRDAVPSLWYVERTKVPDAIAYLRGFGERVYGTKETEAPKKTASAAPPLKTKIAVEEQPAAAPTSPAQPRQLSPAERILALRRAAERQREKRELEALAAEVASEEYGDARQRIRNEAL